MKKKYILKKLLRYSLVNNLITWLFLMTVLAVAMPKAGCTKFVAVKPPITQITSEEVFSSDASAISSINGIYSQMIDGLDFASGDLNSVTILTGLSSDELVDYTGSPDFGQFYTNSLNSTNTTMTSIWTQGYTLIYYANSILEGLNKSNAVSSSAKNELMGEAKFVRAFTYFYMVNLFGDVPYVNSTNYNVNNTVGRSSVAQVYKNVISDLKDAQGLLLSDYSVSKGERIRPNKYAATALLARVYLFTGDWVNAEVQADTVINQSTLYNLNSDLNNVFLKNSTDAIWQLKPVDPTVNTWEGFTFILLDVPTNVALSPQVVSSFDSGDNRRSQWVDSITVGSQTYYYPFKYKVNDASVFSEYSMVLRLSEQYLIRAEARAEQGNGAAVDDLNTIRNRAGLPNYSGLTDKQSLLTQILHERFVELFTEWGHRWLDLKRTNSVDSVMNTATPIKGGVWKTDAKLYPIPENQINNDPNVSQNPGY